MEALRVAVHQPEQVAGRLHETLFEDEVVLSAWRALASTTSVHEAIAAADPSAAALLQRLAVEETDTEPDDVLARLADEAGQRALTHLEAAARNDDDPGRYGPLTTWLKLVIEELREPATRVDATDRLVRWLAEQPV